MSKALISSFFVSNVNETLILLKSNERCERIAHFVHKKMSDHEWFAQVAQRKWAIVSESLRSLTKNEQMNELLVFLSKSLNCSFWAKNEWFAWKTEEQIPSPGPTSVAQLKLSYENLAEQWLAILNIETDLPPNAILGLCHTKWTLIGRVVAKII